MKTLGFLIVIVYYISVVQIARPITVFRYFFFCNQLCTVFLWSQNYVLSRTFKLLFRYEKLVNLRKLCAELFITFTAQYTHKSSLNLFASLIQFTLPWLTNNVVSQSTAYKDLSPSDGETATGSIYPFITVTMMAASVEPHLHPTIICN